jgi:Uma2 family endonuclease
VDRREKLHSYLALPGLLTYLIVDPDTPSVEAHIRPELNRPAQLPPSGDSESD